MKFWPFRRREKALSPVSGGRGWYSIFESYPGAWQQNVTVDQNLVLSYHAVYACITLIAADIAKLRVKLMEQDAAGIWSEVTATSPFRPVLRKPNPMQTRIQFWESWMISKLTRGNAYVLKVRDGRGVVTELHVLDPSRVMTLVAGDGSVFYALSTDNVAGLEADVTVPASEIIHDRFNCLFHPLVGTSPIFAAGVAATQGLNIQNSSASFFGNRSQPGGILTAPGAISDATAERLKSSWETRFSGENAGKIAVLGDGLEFRPMAMTAEESQLIDQLKWSAEVVCGVFHVPGYKVGIGTMPSYNNIQSLNVEYYSQCLQGLIEAAELCLDEGLGLAEQATGGRMMGVEFDLDGLLRMDSVTQMQVLKEGVGAGVISPNEARRRVDLKPVTGGESPYLQQQNYSLAALAKRDAQDDPWAKAAPVPALPAPAAASEPGDAEETEAAQAQARAWFAETVLSMRKAMEAA